MASAHNTVRSGIDQIRARLESLASLRTEHGWTDSEEAEYEQLVAAEKEYLTTFGPLREHP